MKARENEQVYWILLYLWVKIPRSRETIGLLQLELNANYDSHFFKELKFENDLIKNAFTKMVRVSWHLDIR